MHALMMVRFMNLVLIPIQNKLCSVQVFLILIPMRAKNGLDFWNWIVSNRKINYCNKKGKITPTTARTLFFAVFRNIHG